MFFWHCGDCVEKVLVVLDLREGLFLSRGFWIERSRVWKYSNCA